MTREQERVFLGICRRYVEQQIVRDRMWRAGLDPGDGGHLAQLDLIAAVGLVKRCEMCGKQYTYGEYMALPRVGDDTGGEYWRNCTCQPEGERSTMLLCDNG